MWTFEAMNKYWIIISIIITIIIIVIVFVVGDTSSYLLNCVFGGLPTLYAKLLNKSQSELSRSIPWNFVESDLG